MMAGSLCWRDNVGQRFFARAERRFLGWKADVPYIRHPGLDPGPAFLLLNVEKTRQAPGQARGDEEHDGGRFRSLAAIFCRSFDHIHEVARQIALALILERHIEVGRDAEHVHQRP